MTWTLPKYDIFFQQFRFTCVVHELEITKEAFEELSDATSIVFMENFLKLMEPFLGQNSSFNFMFFIYLIINLFIEITSGEVNTAIYSVLFKSNIKMKGAKRYSF